jgi:hypothetical protein
MIVAMKKMPMTHETSVQAPAVRLRAAPGRAQARHRTPA